MTTQDFAALICITLSLFSVPAFFFILQRIA